MVNHSLEVRLMDSNKQGLSGENCLKSIIGFVLILFIVGMAWNSAQGEGPAFSDPNEKLTYPIIDTFLTKCYGNSGEIPCPKPGEPFYGQDANYQDIINYAVFALIKIRESKS